MALYFISYDLMRRKDYPAITKELERFGATKVLLSEWALKYEEDSAEKLRDYFAKFLDNDDKLSVTEVVDWATMRAINTPPA